VRSTDQPALLLGKRCIEGQHEGIGIDAEFRHDERHALRHQAGDEGDVSGEAIQLGDNYGALGGSRSSKGCGELRPAVQSVRALTALDLMNF
jgi:hypothetical protein